MVRLVGLALFGLTANGVVVKRQDPVPTAPAGETPYDAEKAQDTPAIAAAAPGAVAPVAKEGDAAPAAEGGLETTVKKAAEDLQEFKKEQNEPPEIIAHKVQSEAPPVHKKEQLVKAVTGGSQAPKIDSETLKPVVPIGEPEVQKANSTNPAEAIAGGPLSNLKGVTQYKYKAVSPDSGIHPAWFDMPSEEAEKPVKLLNPPPTKEQVIMTPKLRETMEDTDSGPIESGVHSPFVKSSPNSIAFIILFGVVVTLFLYMFVVGLSRLYGPKERKPDYFLPQSQPNLR